MEHIEPQTHQHHRLNMLVRSRYRLVKHLSETLYGAVYLCEDTEQPEVLSPRSVDAAAAAQSVADGVTRMQQQAEPRHVVLKQIDIVQAMQMLNTPNPQQQTLDDPRQEKAVANLLRRTGGHPHVVQYLDDFIEDKTLFFVMEFCADGDLYEYLRKRGKTTLSPIDSMSVLAQVGSGVAFLHGHGVAHRDISLENVMLDDGVCKIADFGLSTRATRRCTEKVGKAYYMAPEVEAATGGIDSVAYDPKAADMWSLGIILFILLTGSPLVPSASAKDKAFCSFQRVGLFGVLNAWGVHHIPREMRDLLNGLLQVNPADRYTVDQVLEHEVFSLLLENGQVEEMDTEQQMQRTPSMSCHRQEGSQLQQQRRTR